MALGQRMGGIRLVFRDMRCRGLAHRLVFTLAGAWFGLLNVMPATLRPCPMHSAPEHGAARAQSAMTLHLRAPFAAPEQAADAHAGMSHGGSPERPGEPPDCDCLGDCCCLPVDAGLARAPHLRSTPRTVHSPIVATAALRVPAAHARLLPFAIGPPSRRNA